MATTTIAMSRLSPRRSRTAVAMSLPRDLWPGRPQPPEDWKDPPDFEPHDSFFLSLRLRFLLFLRRLRIRR